MHASVNERAEPTVHERVRIRFSKQGDLRLIGHRDLVRAMERLFRRAELPLATSQGFHPKPRMSFPAALALGIEGLDEVMEIELACPLEAETLLARLKAHGIPGLDFHNAEVLPPGSGRAAGAIDRLIYEIVVDADRQDEIAQRAAELMTRRDCFVRRPGRVKSLNLLVFLEALNVRDGTLSMTFRVAPGANPGPRDVLAALGLDDLERQGSRLRRTRVELRN